MKALPLAIPDDGLFDITLVEPMPKVTLAARSQRFHSKDVFTHLTKPITGRGKNIEVLPAGKRSTFLETDGELMGTPPYSFNILPHSLRLIAGAAFVPQLKSET